jgi:ABC-type nickel/cobalt efflux system permease component RcnA
MNYLIYVLFCLAATIVFSCKGKEEQNPVLIEAMQIQDEAIHTGLSVDSLIQVRIGADTSAASIKEWGRWAERVAVWRKSMVAVPGVAPLHDHHDHDHGHAHGHDHSHDHAPAASAEGLSPEEIKQVQLSWKAEIDAIRDSLR